MTTNPQATLNIIPLQGIPLVQPGDDIGELIDHSLQRTGVDVLDGDIFVIAQKIISKAENRHVNLETVQPSTHSCAVAADCHKDPRLVEVILRESCEIIKCVPNILIVRHKLGFVMANAGVDHSNVNDTDEVLLLPENPNSSALNIKNNLNKKTHKNIAVLINDSFGRPFRLGTTGVCIGSAGIEVLDIKTGNKDLFGKTLVHTEIAVGDELAAAASLAMGQTDEAIPVVIIRGFDWQAKDSDASALIRPTQQDLFT